MDLAQAESVGRHMRRNLEWVTSVSGITEFAQAMPSSHAQAQLFTFSKTFCPAEAVERFSSLDLRLRSEDLNDVGFRLLSQQMPRIELQKQQARVSAYPFELQTWEKDFLLEFLAPEYDFFEQAKVTISQ